MKKNNMLRIASVLIVAVLLSTCAISVAYAKYITDDDASDKAQVAIWGLDIEASGNLFAKSYGTSVEAAGDYNLVAPGTASAAKWTPFAITGTPEVAFSLTYVPTVTLVGDWKDADGNFYCPVVITVNDEAVDTSSATSIKEYVDAVTAKITALNGTYEANNTTQIKVPTIEWAWDFDDNGAGTNDEKDTFLGNAAATSVHSIEIAIVATATQID